MMPLKWATYTTDQKLRLYLAYNRSYDSLKNFVIFPIGAIIFFRFLRRPIKQFSHHSWLKTRLFMY